MRTPTLLLLGLGASLALADPALAQGPPPSPYNVSWAALDPGPDWAAQVVRSIFPIPGIAAAPSTGQAATIISLIVGQLTGFIAAIAAAFVAYAVLMHIHRAAETSRVLGANQSWMFVVRVGFAGIMMFPIGGGFSAGQALVMQGAMTGVGMARVVYQNAIQAVGPDAITIATPIIPGTQQIVAGLIDSELCRNIINLAANASGASAPLVPAPRPVTGGNADGGFVTYRYALSVGNGFGPPSCGSVTVRTPRQNQQTIAGVTVDMAGVQNGVLLNVLQNNIERQVASVAAEFWRTRQMASLAPLQTILLDATQAYTAALTATATSVASALNAAVQANAQQLRLGDSDLLTGQVQQSTLGWASAGAYYLQIAKYNAATLSLLSATPVTTAPTYNGLGMWLSRDIAPFQAAQRDFMDQLMVMAQTADGTRQPSGTPETLASARASDGANLLERVFASLNLTGSWTSAVARFLLPQAQVWTDPFGGLMNLGQFLMNSSLAAFGLAALLNSPVTAGATAIYNFLTLNWGAAGAAAAGSLVMQFLGTPIFMLLTAILIPGITIAYVLPMVPWVMWMAGVTGWIILVCEAMIAVPLWMLAHMTFGGEGLHGRATGGWGLLFNVVFRPVLMVIGLFLGYFVFAAMSWLIRMTFGTAAGFALANGWFVTNVIGMTVLLWIFISAHIVAAMMSFRMVALLPHHLPNLIGFHAAGRVDMDDFGYRAAYEPGGQLARGTKRAIDTGLNDLGLLPGGQRKLLQDGRRRYNSPGNVIGPPGKPPGGAGSGPMDSTLSATTDMRRQEGRDVQ